MANTQNLQGIRCPQCLSDEAFVVQITSNLVMFDDGVDYMGVTQPEDDHFPERVIAQSNGFESTDPIQCFERRGGCGHRGTVAEFKGAFA